MPQIAGVFGDCIAGGGYMPIISDRVYMTEQAYMVIAGAALIKGAKSQHLSSLDIGGPGGARAPVGLRRRARPRRRDVALRACARSVAKRLPEFRRSDYYRHGGGAPAAPRSTSAQELPGLFPAITA